MVPDSNGSERAFQIAQPRHATDANGDSGPTRREAKGVFAPIKTFLSKVSRVCPEILISRELLPKTALAMCLST
jgi:hypothetical protein